MNVEFPADLVLSSEEAARLLALELFRKASENRLGVLERGSPCQSALFSRGAPTERRTQEPVAFGTRLFPAARRARLSPLAARGAQWAGAGSYPPGVRQVLSFSFASPGATLGRPNRL